MGSFRSRSLAGSISINDKEDVVENGFLSSTPELWGYNNKHTECIWIVILLLPRIYPFPYVQVLNCGPRTARQRKVPQNEWLDL